VRKIAVLCAPILVLFAAPSEKARLAMVRGQIEARGVRDARVLESLRATPRHLFVPDSMQPYAYDDRPLPIGYGQTISQPYIVGLMTELLAPERRHAVLEIGTGSGYQAAVLSPLVKQIYTIEIVPELAASSAATFKRLSLNNITVRYGDGYQGWPEHAPFDRIILTAAPPEIPQALLDQLKRGGRMVAPVGDREQELVVIDKQSDGSLKRRAVLPVMFVPMVPGSRQQPARNN